MDVYKCGKLFFDKDIVEDPTELEKAFGNPVTEYTDEQMSDMWNVYSERVNDIEEKLGLFGGEIGEKWSDGATYRLEDNGCNYEFGFSKAGGVYSIVMRCLSVDEEVGTAVVVEETTIGYVPSRNEIYYFIRNSGGTY